MKHLILFSIVALFFSFTASAQHTIKGYVKNSESNEILPGTTIYIPELRKGTITDENGFYVLNNLPSGKFNIVYSFIGFKKKIKNIDIKKDTTINITLEPTVVSTQEVVVTSNSYTTQHENAIKIVSVNNQILNSATGRTIAEKIACIPGVDFISRGQGITKPVIRGLSNSNIKMLNNGVSMENYQFSENHPYIIDDAGIDHVEVIKGPASLLYGSDVIGGIINVIKEKPAPVGTSKIDFASDYFTNAKGLHSTLGFKSSLKKWYYGIRFSVKSFEDFYDSDNKQVLNSRFNTASIRLQTGYNTSVASIKIYYDYDAMKIGLPLPTAADTIIQNNSRQNNVWFQNLENHFLLMNNTFFVKNYKISGKISYQQNNRQLITTDKTAVDMTLSNTSFNLKSVFPTKINSDLIAGIQTSYATNTDIPPAPVIVLPPFDRADFAIYSLYQQKINKLSLQAGARYEIRMLDIRITDTNEINKKYSNISFSSGLTYHFTKKLLMRMNLASAYRTPNVAELTQNGIHGTRYEKGNPNLLSQRSYEADLGLHYHDKYCYFDIAFFNNNIKKYIYLAPTNSYYQSYLIYQYQQADAVLYGSELDFGYSFKKSDINIAYNYLRAKRSDGQNLPFIPQDKIKLSYKYKIKISRMLTSISLTTIYAFKQDRPAEFETATDAYNLTNIFLQLQSLNTKRPISVSVGINNVFNQKYYDHLSTIKNMGYYNQARSCRINIKIPINP